MKEDGPGEELRGGVGGGGRGALEEDGPGEELRRGSSLWRRRMVPVRRGRGAACEVPARSFAGMQDPEGPSQCCAKPLASGLRVTWHGKLGRPVEHTEDCKATFLPEGLVFIFDTVNVCNLTPVPYTTTTTPPHPTPPHPRPLPPG